MANLLTIKLAEDYSGDLDDAQMWANLSDSLDRLKTRVVWTDAEAAAASQAVKKIWREEISDRQNTNQDIQALINFLNKERLSLDVAARKAVKGSK